MAIFDQNTSVSTKNTCKSESNGPRNTKLGFKKILKYHLCDEKCYLIFVFKTVGQINSNFDKEPNKSLRNPANCYSKSYKIKTSSHRDIK